jgi:hypothetical protein
VESIARLMWSPGCALAEQNSTAYRGLFAYKDSDEYYLGLPRLRHECQQIKSFNYLCKNERDMDTFEKVLNKLEDGLTITFTPQNVAWWDRFLIFSGDRKEIKITFKDFGLWYVLFDNDEPMLLEDCPDSFFDSILLNIK